MKPGIPSQTGNDVSAALGVSKLPRLSSSRKVVRVLSCRRQGRYLQDCPLELTLPGSQHSAGHTGHREHLKGATWPIPCLSLILIPSSQIHLVQAFSTPDCYFISVNEFLGSSLGFQWLRLCASNEGGTGLIPGQKLRSCMLPSAAQLPTPHQKKERKKVLVL